MQRPDSRLARAHARDAAMQRMRRLTFVAVAGATALAGLFSGLVAKAVPGRKTATAPAKTRTAKTSTHTTTTAKIAPAPAPIVPVTGGGDGSQSQSQAQTQTPAAPAQAPVQSYAPPVASTGGS